MSDLFDPGLLPEWAKYENGNVYVETGWQALEITNYWPPEHDPYVQIIVRDRNEAQGLRNVAKTLGVRWGE